MRSIYGEEVFGVGVDPQTRCAHYHGETDIIAIKFKCCNSWFPCFECHLETEDHVAKVWHSSEFNQKAVLCGACGNQMAITEYLNCESTCPKCGESFNPKCAGHYPLYFDV